MGRKIDRIAVVVDGSDWVAIRPEDFDRLDASRRQVGASAARATRLEHEVRQTRARLARIEAILAEADPADCVCERLNSVLHGPGVARPVVRSRRRR
ncbi:hypothetical protein ACFY2R_26280 [Micromonospora olivasterospora]|uniref:Uncharacterized protein n=1 Tax=Micromonospora olivasterospora TaxID=1880 RepID=A0A562I969_MICOL|nr:hypothetical protein [Micromonospora olivasterospora]TWH67184.1 hypothetical protein JD77_02154 [Micromonospora olivasterospora]